MSIVRFPTLTFYRETGWRGSHRSAGDGRRGGGRRAGIHWGRLDAVSLDTEDVRLSVDDVDVGPVDGVATESC